MDFNQEGGFNTGDFVASGPAVEQGLICESGTVEDTRLIFAGFQSPTGRIQIPVRKTFTCDDGSGEIFIKIQVHLDLNAQTETFSWVVLGGTGDYSASARQRRRHDRRRRLRSPDRKLQQLRRFPDRLNARRPMARVRAPSAARATMPSGPRSSVDRAQPS